MADKKRLSEKEIREMYRLIEKSKRNVFDIITPIKIQKQHRPKKYVIYSNQSGNAKDAQLE